MPLAEQVEGDQRRAVAASLAAFPQREEGQNWYRRGHGHESPPRPVQFAALDQRVEQEQEANAADADADWV
jgi:hypothetical protein